MTRYLIINADDFGLSYGVNKGILEAHRDGIVTSTSVMINLPAAEGGIRLVQEKAPQLGLGLHVNLSSGSPVSPQSEVPSLIYAKFHFCSNMDELLNSVQDFEAEEVIKEIYAQMERFIEIAGHPPTHIDSHHAITCLHPAAMEAVLKLSEEYHVPVRNCSTFMESGSFNGYFDLGGRAMDRNLIARMRHVYTANGTYRWSTTIDRAPAFTNSNASRKDLIDFMENLPEGIHELICHPGYAYDLHGAYTSQRERELKILTDSRVRVALDRAGIQPISFADIPADHVV